MRGNRVRRFHLMLIKACLLCFFRSNYYILDYGPGFTFNCESYSCQHHVAMPEGYYFAGSNETYREGCAKRCCDNHNCNSIYWLKKSRNCFLSQLRNEDTYQLIPHYNIESDICAISKGKQFYALSHISSLCLYNNINCIIFVDVFPLLYIHIANVYCYDLGVQFLDHINRVMLTHYSRTIIDSCYHPWMYLTYSVAINLFPI